MKKRQPRFYNHLLFVYGIPLAVLVFGIIMTVLLRENSLNIQQEQLRSELQADSYRITRNIEQRLNAYQLVLRGARGLYNSSNHVTKGEFSEYVSSLRLEEFYPGIQGLGFVLWLSDADKDNLIERMKAEGNSDYSISPESKSDFYAPIIYMEPSTGLNRKALGLDIHQLEFSRPYFFKARDTNEITITKKLILKQFEGQDEPLDNLSKYASFVMYLPVYKNGHEHKTVDQRRKNILGWIDAPFRMFDFMSGILEQVPNTVDIEIFDGVILTKDNMLFDLDGIHLRKGELSEMTTINIHGHIWTITYNYIGTINRLKVLYIIIGLLISLLSSLLALSLTTGRSRSQKLADQLAIKFRKSERLFRTYFERSNIGMATADVSQNWARFNAALCDMLGYTNKEMFKLNWMEITHNEDLKQELPLFRKLVEGEIPYYTLEKRLIHKMGKLIYVSVYVQIIYNDDNEVDFVAGLIQDISDRHQSEEKLKASENRFKTMVNNIEGIVWEARARDLEIIYISDQVKRITGFSAKQWVQPGFWLEHIHPDDKDWVLAHTSDCIDRLQNHSIEYRFIAADGEIIWFRDMITIVTKNDLPSKLRGILINITEQKENEHYQHQLEAQLRQSQKMESLGTLSGGIAHDFNNMLGVILGNSELLKSNIAKGSHIDTEKASKHLKSLHSASERAAGLVSQILTFSRMTPEKLEPLKVSSVVRDAVSMLRETTSNKIEINVDIDDNIKSILANENQIHQIIVNLFTNSLHALDGNDDKINISLQNLVIDSSAQDIVRLSVSDNGKGMSEEIKQRIFDPFFTTKGVGKGTGLGLAVIHGIVKNHGAEILVESEVGKGTSFIIHFPVIDEQPLVLAEESLTSELSGKGTILIAEDEPHLLAVYREFLEDIGYKVICAENGHEAYEIVVKDPTAIDILLTDLAMPLLTGKELAERLQHLATDIPIILMTGFDDGLTKAELRELGINKCIIKPVAFSPLSHAINKLINKD